MPDRDSRGVIPLPPAVFVHIPATVDAGFLASLGNAYGEAACRRVPRAGAGDAAAAALLHGPAPWHVWAGRRDALRPFTLLRHPVARVQALFRTLRAEPAELLARWGLAPGFSFDAFIDSTHRGIAEHVGNGMCRMLSADPGFTTPGGPAFDDPAAAPILLDQAVATLDELPFGLAEDMPASLRLLEAAWGIPYALAAAPEPQAAAGEEAQPRNIARIAARNPFDIALYETAVSLFRARLAAAPPLVFRHDPASLCAVPAGAWVEIGAIAGRQGFHPPESHGVAWLHAEATSRLHFRGPARPAALSLRVLCVREGYPLHRVRLLLDGRRLDFTVEAVEGRWATLRTEPLDLSGRLHVLSLAPPYAVPVRTLTPGSADLRRLSLGIAKLLFGG